MMTVGEGEEVLNPPMPSEYPHMMPEDLPVWRSFLKDGGIPAALYDYDIKVGTPISGLGDMPEPYRSNSEMLSQKRIDAVATTDNEIWIIEVKDEASWSAIGQALGYRLLFVRDFQPALPVVPLIVARHFPPDVLFIIEQLEIPYSQVSELVLEPLPQPEP